MIDPALSGLHVHRPPEAATRATQALQPDLLEAARGFEALFLTQVLKTARAASLGEALGEGQGMDTTRTLLDQALADAGAQRAGLGLAEAIHRQFAGRG
ncbi:MAG: rod-binding protein [Pseudomonadota bacterium]